MEDVSRRDERSADASCGQGLGRSEPVPRHQGRSHGFHARHLSGLSERRHPQHRSHGLVRAILAAATAVLCLLSGVLLALLLRATAELRTTRDRLLGEVQAAQSQAAQQEAAASRLQAQMADLVQGRLPAPLLPLVLDQLIPLDQAPLRSILFTHVGTPDALGYEYRLVCRNEKSERFQAEIRILLFNEAGVQTGWANVNDSTDWNRVGGSGLAAGENAAFSGRVTLQFADVPKYFLLIILSPDRPLARLGG